MRTRPAAVVEAPGLIPLVPGRSLDRPAVRGSRPVDLLLLGQPEHLASLQLELACQIVEGRAGHLLEPLLALERPELIDRLEQAIGVASKDCVRTRLGRRVMVAHRLASLFRGRLRPAARVASRRCGGPTV